MAPKSKDASAAPTITTHHSMAAGGQPSAAHEPSENPESTAGEDTKVVLTRPKKLILQPTHVADASDDEKTEQSGDDAPLVLETAAGAEAAASKLAAKLPEDKIELPLQDVALEEVADDEPAEQPKPSEPSADLEAPDGVKDPGESAGATAEVDPNEARAQKAEALMTSGKYVVRIHESSHSRTGLIAAMITGALLVLVATYWAASEGMLDVGVDLPKFW